MYIWTRLSVLVMNFLGYFWEIGDFNICVCVFGVFNLDGFKSEFP